MQQEDDLRGLARVMDFMRAVSILFVGINVYWFCYSTLKELGVTFEVMDKILWNFQRTTGLFSSVLWTKLFAVVFLALSCIGTKGVKDEKITWVKIYCCLAAGVMLFFFNWWLLELSLPHTADTAFYIATLSVGYICLLMAVVGLIYGALTATLQLRSILTNFGIIALIAFLNNVCATVFLHYGVQYAGAGLCAILSVFEPLGSIVIGAILLHEQLTLRQMLSCVLILGSICFLIVSSARREKAAGRME